MAFPSNRIFESEQLIPILNRIKGKTLGEIDSQHVFETHKAHKGLAGAVIEQSVLGYPSNSEQGHDILLDGRPTEVKTTGLKRTKYGLVAKEPVSITAVGIEHIVHEEFYNSHFWDKAEQILFVYYVYDSARKVEYKEYARFCIIGSQIHRFDEHDRNLLKKDWECIRDFIRMLQRDYEHPEEQYPRLSHELRAYVILLDTAPKYPHNPRFRLKRSYADHIVHQYLLNESQERLPIEINGYADLDEECQRITDIYKGKTVGELAHNFGLTKITKMASEQLIVRMFGGKSKKISRIEQFNRYGVICKSIVLSCKNKRTEDCKLYTVDFEECLDADISDFSDSVMYDYFANRQFVFAVFKEPYDKCPFAENRFLGFTRVTMPDEVLGFAYDCWNDFRTTYFSGNLKETVVVRDGKPVINRNGTVRTSVNYPKSSTHTVFFRGTGSDSTSKTESIGELKLYATQVWIKGKYLAEQIVKRIS